MAEKKFIPDRDVDCAQMARNFSVEISRNPDRYLISTAEAAEIREAVQAFRDALAVAIRPSSRTKMTIMKKDAARKEAVRVIRRYANRIRANDAIDPLHKSVLDVRERPKRLKKRRCPQVAPSLQFLGSDDVNHSGMGGVHVIAFRTAKILAPSKAKPHGAARLELFFEFVKPGQPVPSKPDELSGWPRYVRSFTTTPMRVKHPVPAASMGPMLLVYWARWADATGEVGPWSQTLVTRIEGAAHVPESISGVREVEVGSDDAQAALKLAG